MQLENYRQTLIQIIEDDLPGLIVLKKALEEKGWMVIADTDPEKATNHYFEMNPDCLILNANLSTKNGFQILEEIKQHNDKLFLPKIMLSSQNDQESRMNAYKNGADDFIEKPYDIDELIIRLERHLLRKQIYDQSALIDPLTLVYNKNHLFIDLEKSIKEWKRSGDSLTIAILDFDNFSFLNHRYGHITGDFILSEFARFLKQNIRSGDTVYRIGGGQFLVQFPRARDYEVKEIVSRLLSDFSNKSFESNGQFFCTTFSTGIFELHNYDLSTKTVIQMAEKALNKAKDEGKARVEIINETSASFVKKPLFISVIDHDIIIRTMLIKIFQSLNLDHYQLNIEVFEDGVNFFHSNRLEEKGKHFLVFEGIMPLMNGIEILQKIKKYSKKPQMRILMLAGKKDENEIARALRLGADDYMTKPFSITELKARIERLIQRMV